MYILGLTTLGDSAASLIKDGELIAAAEEERFSRKKHHAGFPYKAIENEFLLIIKVMVRTLDEIKGIIKNNPFAGQFENEKDLHVFFLNDKLPEDKRELLLSNNNDNEQYAAGNREIFCLLRVSVLDSLMGKDYIGKKLKVSATARNWRTVNKILEL